MDTGLDSDEDLRAAIELGARLVVARVRAVAQDRVGTRSQTAGYEIEVERALEEVALPPVMAVKHFGVPRLEEGRRYRLAVVDSGRHHGAWELRFASVAADADPDRDLAAFRDRRDRVKDPPR